MSELPPSQAPSANEHPAAQSAETLQSQCDIRRLRRSGPGGQHRNKVETAVQLHHRPTGIQAEANERRSQAENLQVALRRLRINLALEIRTTRSDAAVPSRLWQSRVQGGRISLSAASDDFPTLLAEALDVLAASEWEVRPAVERLGITASQLVKLVQKELRAATLVNHERQQRGRRTLQ